MAKTDCRNCLAQAGLRKEEADAPFYTESDSHTLSLGPILEAVLEKNAPFRFKARGSSMLPFIMDSDLITVSPLSAQSLKVGKVVAFINPVNNKLTVHRIIGSKNGGYLLKGDSVSRADGVVTKKNILGCVTKLERDKRNISFGLGAERLPIAFLSKIGIFSIMLLCWNNFLPAACKRFIKGKINSH